MTFYKLGIKASSFWDPTQPKNENKKLAIGEAKELEKTPIMLKYLNGGGIIKANDADIKTSMLKNKILKNHILLNDLSRGEVDFKKLVLECISNKYSWKYYLNEFGKPIGKNYESNDFFENCIKINNCLFEIIESSKKLNLAIKDISNLEYEDIVKNEIRVQKAYDFVKNRSRTGIAAPVCSISEIALSYVYSNQCITRENGPEIAKNRGHNKGSGLYQKYLHYSFKTNRTALPDPFSKKRYNNKIQLFEKVIKTLDGKHKQEAIIDLTTLQSSQNQLFLK